MVASGKHQDTADFGPDSSVFRASEKESPVDTDVLIAQVRRQALADPWLRAHASEHELTYLTDMAVRALWRDSTVKTFVAALAMRQVRDQLERREETSNGDQGTPGLPR